MSGNGKRCATATYRSKVFVYPLLFPNTECNLVFILISMGLATGDEMSLRELKATKSFLTALSEVRRNSPGDAAMYFLDIIDNKTSSLLTHVSVMMAILAIFYSAVAGSNVIRIAVLVEIFAYLIVTLGCLRSIFIVGPKKMLSKSEEILEATVRVVISRRRSYRWSLFLTIITTIAFIVTLVVHLSQMDLTSAIRTFLTSPHL